MASHLFAGSDPINKFIQVRGEPFQVIGVYHSNASFLAGDDPHGYIPIQTALRVLNAGRRMIGISVVPREAVSRDEALDEVTALMRQRHGLRPTTDNDFAVITQDKLFETYNKVFGMFFLVMLVLSAIGLIVGGVGVIAIMMISVTERTREIGVRKASRRDARHDPLAVPGRSRHPHRDRRDHWTGRRRSPVGDRSKHDTHSRIGARVGRRGCPRDQCVHRHPLRPPPGRSGLATRSGRSAPLRVVGRGLRRVPCRRGLTSFGYLHHILDVRPTLAPAWLQAGSRAPSPRGASRTAVDHSGNRGGGAMRQDRRLRAGPVLTAMLLGIAMANTARAQSIDTLRARFRLPPSPARVAPAANLARSAPGSSESSPSAFGARFGDAFIGISYQASQRHDTKVQDGAAFGGIGLGDPVGAVGFEVTVTSYSTLRNAEGQNSGFNFMRVGGVSAMLHRQLPGNFAIAVGAENALQWGAAGDGGSDVYAVVSTHQQLTADPSGPFGSVTLNAGLGTGRFRPWIGDRFTGGPDSTGVGIFASGGLRLASSTSFIADFSGQDLALGFSVAPFPHVPIVFTPVMADVLGRANPTARFVLGVGYGFHFSQFFH